MAKTCEDFLWLYYIVFPHLSGISGTGSRFPAIILHNFLLSGLLGTDSSSPAIVLHGFLLLSGLLGTDSQSPAIVLHGFLLLSGLLGTGSRSPAIVLHRLLKSRRTNLKNDTVVPNCPEYCKKPGEQIWGKALLYLTARNTAKSMGNKFGERLCCT